MEYIKRTVQYVQLECTNCKKENKVIIDSKTNKEQDEYGEVYIEYCCSNCGEENTRHLNLDNDL